MPWGNRQRGQWQGAGPYSNLPPWQRPGWLYGRGACWQLLGPNLPTTIKPEDETALLSQQKALLEEQLKTIQERLGKIQQRLNELSQ